ncbi:Txe/YoeB family addiction module toxin [Paludibaculum fermentans]|uniref:Putative mRNA interferase YoeB n=1 Tax=Paludibaculum fermentans TaxID=1473598 RepID=A0A7S7NXG0_PALFE|nr:Txe/YoeB family addiction module toxin [Paludibaculum fermentans]QOY90974.1 Txe/YoeB family addiction module toxin [Paludibaculum fermentans]
MSACIRPTAWLCGPDKAVGTGKKHRETRGHREGLVALFRQRLLKSECGVAGRVLHLVERVMRDPFGGGTGKPGPLKQVLALCWSRRVTQEHRLVYPVADESAGFRQARITIEWDDKKR